jgi:hypothetical protein
MKSTKKYFNSDNKFNKIVEARLGRRKAQSGLGGVHFVDLGIQNASNIGASTANTSGSNLNLSNIAQAVGQNVNTSAAIMPTPAFESFIPSYTGASETEDNDLTRFQRAQNDFMGAARSRENLLEGQKLAEGKEDPFSAFAGEATSMSGKGDFAKSGPQTLDGANPSNFGTTSADIMGQNTSGVPDFVSGQQAAATTATSPIAGMTTTGGAGSAGAAKGAMSKAGVPLAMVKSFGAAVSAGANDQDPTTYTGMEVAGDVLSLRFGEIGKKIKNREVARAARDQAEAAEKTAGQNASQAYDQAFSVTAPFTGQTYGEDTGTRNRYVYEKGGVKDGAKDVSNLGKMPEGAAVSLPGGKAVSLGQGIVEYKGNSHEKGGILTGGKETIEVEGGELEVPAKTAEGGAMRYILSDYPKFAVNGETPADMVRNGKPIQDAVKINEFMASRIPTEYGGPADPSRSPDKFAQAGLWRTEDDEFKFPATRTGYLDMGGNINASSWMNVQNTDWGQYYGVDEQTTQDQLKEIYNNQYMKDVNKFYSEDNKAQAIETLQLFAETETPAGDNFKKAFRGLDFNNQEHHQRILATARKKSTDGKIGAFHFMPALSAAETDGEEVTGATTAITDVDSTGTAVAAETTADVAATTLNVAEKEKEKIPGLGYKGENAVPGLAFLGMGAGLLPAFAPKVPPAELIKGTPGIRAPRLPRENLKGQEAAVASDFAATIESLERAGNSSSGIYNNLLYKKLSADSQTAAKELSANKQLAGQEAGLRLRASEANMSAETARQARNADAINRREEFKQEQVRADIDNITKNVQESLKATMAYKSENELANAIDVYDTRGYNRTIKMYQKERDKANRRNDADSPFYNKTDDELRQAAQSEISSRTGFDPEDKTMPLEQVMKMLELMTKTKPKQAGGKKYFSKINKIRR